MVAWAGRVPTGDADLRGPSTPCNHERVLALYYWRFPSLIAAPPRQHGLGGASFFRRSAAEIVRLGGVGGKRGALPMLLGLFLVPAVDRWLERFDAWVEGRWSSGRVRRAGLQT